MAWNPDVELLKAAKKIADKKHPNGYAKKQLVDASKEVNCGFSTSKLKKIKTMEDVGHIKNHMASIDGHYPLSMTGCEVVGINGGCGFDCPVFLDFGCKELGDWAKEDLLSSDEIDDELKADLIEYYFK